MTLSSAPPEEDSEGDVGLQLQVNFVDKAVQRNARLAGKWGKAENTLSFFPFAPGESFKVEFGRCWHLKKDQPSCEGLACRGKVWDAVVHIDRHVDLMWTFTQPQQGAALLFCNQKLRFLPSSDRNLPVNEAEQRNPRPGNEQQRPWLKPSALRLDGDRV